ncbi:hypothetical protein HNP84_004618 [Thermocatellispora tengchongensis]|uniref:DUF3068 domain-containing protein n=1 Tax=Thermocatellispora tengchongensis TaxID=1073253 RepID=A0A840P0W6_9ACTN|nr:DUF3068 domain-containing protein [Thermocatellispora tengchongensis]MBB5134884.1 hypothetical protein [Thermocatellispora tengchongensis]
MIDRRYLAVLALAGGAFLVTLGLLARFYVYPGALAIPAEQSRIVHMRTADATFFDTLRLRTRRGVSLDQAIARYGDGLAATAHTAVWTEFVSLTTVTGERLDYHERRVAFDRRTGELVDCCGAYVDELTRPGSRGLAFRWPFGARPVAYPVYDLLVRRPVTARFDGIEELRGLRVYRYVQRFANERMAQPGLPLPARVLGLRGEAEVPTTPYLDGTRTYWVEPDSGIVIAVRENLTRTLRTPDRKGKVVALAADMRTSEGDERYSAEQAAAFRRWNTLNGLVVPGALVGLGVAALGYGALAHSRPDGRPAYLWRRRAGLSTSR